MVTSVVVIGAVMTVILIIIGFLFTKVSKNGIYFPYFPSMVIFLAGIVFVVAATMVGRIEITGAPLGGWGIAFLFSSAIAFLITSIVDAYARPA